MNLKLLTVPAALAGLTLVAFTGCNKQEKLSSNNDTTYDRVAADMKAATTDMANTVSTNTSAAWNDLKTATYERQSDFNRELKAMDAQYEADASKLRSEYDESKASASRKAAMAELKNSEADFKQKMSAVGTASKDTWNSARADAAASWDRLQAAYQRARAEH